MVEQELKNQLGALKRDLIGQRATCEKLAKEKQRVERRLDLKNVTSTRLKSDFVELRVRKMEAETITETTKIHHESTTSQLNSARDQLADQGKVIDLLLTNVLSSLSFHNDDFMIGEFSSRPTEPLLLRSFTNNRRLHIKVHALAGTTEHPG